MADYNKLKVVELKDLLKERGIPSTGLSRKQQIVEALEASDAELKEVGDGVEAPDQVANGAPVATQGGEAADATQAAADVENGGDDPQEELPATSQMDIAPNDDSQEPSAPDVMAVGSQMTPTADATETATPVPATPSSFTSEVKKRKRRSPTPTLSASSVTKKLKTADEDIVKLPEDAALEGQSTPAVVDSDQDSGAQQVQSDDVEPQFETAQAPLGIEDATEQTRALSADPDAMSGVVLGGAPARHPKTEALYIRNLVRPLQPQQLRSYLVELAAPSSTTLDTSPIKDFHLDSLRTHAFVVFSSQTAAIRVRSSLHDRIWPDEPARKPLWVDFVPEEKVQGWVDIENGSGSDRRDAKRWEVVYTDGDDGVTTTLEEATPIAAPASAPVGRQPSFSNDIPGPGMPNAPTGPRGSRRPSPPPRDAEYEQRDAPAANTETFGVLDERFEFTSTKPKLYFLPIGPELVNRRLDELDDLTSRDWDPERHGSFSYAEGTQRRYTFEDGDRLVDGGPDIGNFGKPPTSARRGRGRGMR